MKAILNHVAYLVTNIESAVHEMQLKAANIGEIEEFSGEGTRELYVGASMDMGRLLLMQAIGAGPYMNALKKRGVGLHHIALDVLNLDDYLENLSGSGWLLHPKSLAFYKQSKTVFISRPGIPLLVEVQERKKLMDESYYIKNISIPFKEQRLHEALCCERLSMGNEIQLHF